MLHSDKYPFTDRFLPIYHSSVQGRIIGSFNYFSIKTSVWAFLPVAVSKQLKQTSTTLVFMKKKKPPNIILYQSLSKAITELSNISNRQANYFLKMCI